MSKGDVARLVRCLWVKVCTLESIALPILHSSFIEAQAAHDRKADSEAISGVPRLQTMHFLNRTWKLIGDIALITLVVEGMPDIY